VGAACVAIVLEVLTGVEEVSSGLVHTFRIAGGSLLNWKGLILAAVLLVLTNKMKTMIIAIFALSIGHITASGIIPDKR
jgi:hypothetical protein